MTDRYGTELILDLHGCNVARFTRPHLRTFFRDLCGIIEMKPEALYFWDDEGVSVTERQTDPRTKGTSAVQFILTSSIVIHTLDIPGDVYLNLFSCQPFDVSAATEFVCQFFTPKGMVKQEVVERT